MSLNKRLCKTSPTEVRQSFSERICDDLCEEILQYLSLEDKLRLESVSKKFQKTLFQRHCELNINLCEFKGCGRLFKNRSTFDLKSLEVLMKKSPNIKSIDLDLNDSDFQCNNYNEFIDLITKYCNNLIEFKSPSVEISDSALEAFHNKFGSKLKVFRPLNDKIMDFPELQTLFIYSKSWHILGVIPEIIDGFPSLRYFNLDVINHFPNLLNPVLKSTSKLKDLIHLKLHTFNGVLGYFESLLESLKQIANNCQKLKSIDFDIDLNNDLFNNFLLRQLLSPLKEFKQLSRLTLKIRYDTTEEVYHKHPMDIIKWFSMKEFEDLPNITHLTFIFHPTFELKANIFTDIENYLPNLQSLALFGVIGVQESSQIADILSHHSKLKTIKIKSPSDSFCKTIGEEISQKCPQIKNIVIKWDQTLLNLEENEEPEESN